MSSGICWSASKDFKGSVCSGWMSNKNKLGSLIEIIVNEYMNFGSYQFEWNAKEIPSGLYFIKAQFGQNILSEKIVLVK